MEDSKNKILMDSMRCLKYKIDELLDKSESSCDSEIISLISSLQKLLREHSNLSISAINNSDLNSNSDELPMKMKKLFGLIECLCKEIDTIMNNLKQTLSTVHKMFQDIIKEKNDNKQLQDADDCDVDKRYKKQLECYETYISELECRLKESMRHLSQTQMSNKNHPTEEFKLRENILRLQKKENDYENKIKTLTDELNDLKDKFSNYLERQKCMNEVISEIAQPKGREEKSLLSSIEVEKYSDQVGPEMSSDREFVGVENQFNRKPFDHSNKPDDCFINKPNKSFSQPKAYSSPVPRTFRKKSAVDERSEISTIYGTGNGKRCCSGCSNNTSKTFNVQRKPAATSANQKCKICKTNPDDTSKMYWKSNNSRD